MRAFRAGEVYPAGHDEAGEPTVDATIGSLLEAQTMRATIDIAAVLKGMGGARG